MDVLKAIAYTLSAVCFLSAVFGHKLTSITLDTVALGLFLGVLPSAVEALAPFV